MTFFKIRKRNGVIQTFDKQKIYHAIQKAFVATGVHDDIQLDMLVEQVMAKLNAEHTDLPDVELVQDTVEAVLIHNDHDMIAKAYILYRQKRAEARATRNVVVEVGQTMEEYLDRSDRRINANANSSYSLG